MRPYETPKGTRAIITSLAAVALLSGLPFSAEAAVASASQNVVEGRAMNPIQRQNPSSGYTLPPLSDHILFA